MDLGGGCVNGAMNAGHGGGWMPLSYTTAAVQYSTLHSERRMGRPGESKVLAPPCDVLLSCRLYYACSTVLRNSKVLPC